MILHSTGPGSSDGVISWLEHEGNSYNFLILHDGTVVKLLPEENRANHAGVSEGWSGPNCNDYTIGVSFHNPNDGTTPITSAQRQAAIELLRSLKVKYGSLKVSTHYGVSYPRKTDPQLVNARGIAIAAGCEYWPGRRAD